ncbi:MAG: cell division protein SepF [Clostridiaceae bacterium]|nr:cell division protein SepF [Clostridiaceae bacterium]
MAGIFEKLFGKTDNYDDYDYDEYNDIDDYYDELGDSDDTTEETIDNRDYQYNKPIVEHSKEHRRPNNRVVEINQKSYQQQIVIMEPSNIETAQQVCDDVRSGKTVICNIEKIDPKIAQRVIDFITGAAHALRGNVMPISALIFVVAPGTTMIKSSVIAETQSDSDSVEEFVRRAAVTAR